MSARKKTQAAKTKTPSKAKSPRKGKSADRRKSSAVRGRSTTAEFEALIRKTRDGERYVLKLYVTGASPRSAQAVANIRSLCDEHLSGRYDLEVVDIYQQPAEASGAQIIAAPTLVKQFPALAKRMVGDLSNRARVLLGLDLHPADPTAEKPKTQWMAL
jgi:circadian clock protein KaiB